MTKTCACVADDAMGCYSATKVRALHTDKPLGGSCSDCIALRAALERKQSRVVDLETALAKTTAEIIAAGGVDAQVVAVDAFERGVLAGKGAIPNEADLARAERNGIISRLRARWPHIQVCAGPRSFDKSEVRDPGPPVCLRCCIEDEIGEPFHDGLGPARGGAAAPRNCP